MSRPEPIGKWYRDMREKRRAQGIEETGAEEATQRMLDEADRNPRPKRPPAPRRGGLAFDLAISVVSVTANWLAHKGKIEPDVSQSFFALLAMLSGQRHEWVNCSDGIAGDEESPVYDGQPSNEHIGGLLYSNQDRFAMCEGDEPELPKIYTIGPAVKALDAIIHRFIPGGMHEVYEPAMWILRNMPQEDHTNSKEKDE